MKTEKGLRVSGPHKWPTLAGRLAHPLTSNEDAIIQLVASGFVVIRPRNLSELFESQGIKVRTVRKVRRKTK